MPSVAAGQVGAAPTAGRQPTNVRSGLGHLQEQFRDLADRVAPSVVAVSAVSVEGAACPDVTAGPAGAWGAGDLNGEQLAGGLSRVPRTVGTAFAIDAEGYLLTNEHVVRDAGRLWVTLDDGRVLSALVVGSDPRADLAVLKVPARLPALEFADPDGVRRGDFAVALGNPVGLGTAGTMSFSVGVVSARHRSLAKLSASEGRFYHDLIQTTADINPGNSGGPLLDLDGRVIGVIAAVVLPYGTTDGIGFALPADDALRAKVGRLKRGDPTPYGYLGVTVSTATPGQRRAAGVEGCGVRVDRVDPASPAAGVLEEGDLVLDVDGEAVADGGAFVRLVGNRPAGERLTIARWRDGPTPGPTPAESVGVTLARRAAEPVAVTAESQRLRWRGLELAPAAAGSRGVRVAAIDAPDASLPPDVKVGSVIAAVAGRPTPDLIALQQVLNDVPAERCRLALADPTPAPAPGGAPTAAVASVEVDAIGR